MNKPWSSALPDHYYYVFAVYEPILCLGGLVGTLLDPKSTHDAQAPWPADIQPPAELPRATLVTIIQLAHVCALLGVVNVFVLRALRLHLASDVVLQEKLTTAFLTPLLIGDFGHLYVTIWALGDQKWDIANWSPMLWTTVILGCSLLVPRFMWFMGFGRYVHTRDCQAINDKGAQ